MVDVTLRGYLPGRKDTLRRRRRERTAREQLASAAHRYAALGWPVCQGAHPWPAQDEWWSCHLDCVPDEMPQAAGLRWHCRNSYVPAPPSRDGAGMAARWLREPEGRPLPDAVRLLEYLADAGDEQAHSKLGQMPAATKPRGEILNESAEAR